MENKLPSVAAFLGSALFGSLIFSSSFLQAFVAWVKCPVYKLPSTVNQHNSWLLLSPTSPITLKLIVSKWQHQYWAKEIICPLRKHFVNTWPHGHLANVPQSNFTKINWWHAFVFTFDLYDSKLISAFCFLAPYCHNGLAFIREVFSTPVFFNELAVWTLLRPGEHLLDNNT